MHETNRKIIDCGRRVISRNRERRATYPGSIGRQHGRRGFASVLDFDRFLFTLGAHRPSFDSGPVDTSSDPGTQLNTSPGSSEDKRDIPYRANVAPNAQPTDSGDVLPPFASLLRDRDEDDDEEDRDEEYGAATLPIILLPQPESVLSSAAHSGLFNYPPKSPRQTSSTSRFSSSSRVMATCSISETPTTLITTRALWLPRSHTTG